MLIAIDMGQSDIKATNGIDEFYHPNTFYKGDKLGSGIEVKYKGETFVVGDVSGSREYQTSKQTLAKKVACYLTIAQFTENNETVDVVVGCPIEVFINKGLRKEFEDYLNEPYVEVVVDGAKKTFFIDSVTAVAESSGVVFKYQQKFQHKLVGVIDIGGLNTNCSCYEKLALDRGNCFTNKLGINMLHQKIMDEINQNGGNISLKEVKYELEDLGSRHLEIINRVCKNHCMEIKLDLQRHGWSDNLSLVFTGGGSLLLGRYLKECFPRASFTTKPHFDNAYGFYAIGEIIHG